jgi:hypothetical protein
MFNTSNNAQQTPTEQMHRVMEMGILRSAWLSVLKTKNKINQ